MNPTSHPPDPASRRDFLGLTLIAPAAAAGSLLGLGAAPEPAVAAVPPPETTEHRGYHRSAHIDTYYASLRY